MEDGQFVQLKLSQVEPGNNYRKHYDKQKMKELTASIKEHGVLQPVIVRKKGKAYEIVVGERRRRGSVDAGKKTIPCIVRDFTDEQVREIQAIENIQREDPNPMDEAVGFKELLELGKHTVESLALRFSKGKSYVYTRLKLNDLPKDCQEALLSGEIELGIALQLARLADKKDMSDMLREVLDQDMSVFEVRSHIQREYGQRMDAVIFDKSGCDKCPNRSVTQAALFPGVDGDDDRCMDEKCWRGKYMAHLEMLGRDANAKGHNVITGLEEVRRLDRKGVRIHNQTPLKPKCKPCKERVFFYADNGGHLAYGWWCPSKKCHDEVYYGIVPKSKTDAKTRGHGDAEKEQGGNEPELGADPYAHVDKVDVPGLTDEVMIVCPCCWDHVKLVPQVAEVEEVVDAAKVEEG